MSCCGFVVSVGGCPGLGSRRVCPPFPSWLGCAFVCLLFFFSSLRPSVVCVGRFGLSLLPVGCCSRFGVAGFGWVVLRFPFGGFCLRCRLAGGPLVVWVGDFVAVGLSRAPSPCLFFLSGGGGQPVPPSAFLRLAHALVGIWCGQQGGCWRLRCARPCPRPMGRVGYVHAWLGSPSCRVRFWLCPLGGYARRLREVLG